MMRGFLVNKEGIINEAVLVVEASEGGFIPVVHEGGKITHERFEKVRIIGPSLDHTDGEFWCKKVIEMKPKEEQEKQGGEDVASAT